MIIRRKFNMYLANCQSLAGKPSKFENVSKVMDDHQPDLLMLPESKLTSEHDLASLTHDGYTLRFVARPRVRDLDGGNPAGINGAGGVAVYIKNTIRFKKVSDEQKEDWPFELLALKIKAEVEFLLIVVYYNTHAKSNDEVAKLVKKLKALTRNSENFCICGDFNHANEAAVFEEFMNDYDLVQHVRHPTRGESILDLVITPEGQIDGNVAVGVGSNRYGSEFADHADVKFTYKIEKQQEINVVIAL